VSCFAATRHLKRPAPWILVAWELDEKGKVR
jgi:hypothetical protein